MNWSDVLLLYAPLLAIILLQFKVIFMLLNRNFIHQAISNMDRIKHLLGKTDEPGC